MYLDSIVVTGLVIVAFTCAVVGYVGLYAYRHIKSDTERFESKSKSGL